MKSVSLPKVGSQPCRSVSQGVECYSCLPKTAWPPTYRLQLTDNGNRVLNFFENRISEDKKAIIDNYIDNNINNIKNEISIAADYTIENTSSYLVNLRAVENAITLIDIKLSVPTNKQARDLCAKWKENSSALYTKIISLLIEDN